MMPHKNYRSEASRSSIFAAIEQTLTAHGAKQIIRDYGPNGRVVSLTFVVPTVKGNVAVRLPAKVDKVEQIFERQKLRYSKDQPYRTAWATLRDWLDAQMALFEWDMVKVEEVFLPYMINSDGRTYFEVLEQRDFVLPRGEK